MLVFPGDQGNRIRLRLHLFAKRVEQIGVHKKWERCSHLSI
ncbi:hypothetical protein RMSM_01127 [Rhodopirellula maiorica SM1]|uniref:Uncharacterized protein n=1 Tax=Rhodopirellula maiorica SM1 TaxID=1265738 RepID=M5RRV6_9BACT|nr:hypothetical protein RMSM_01127 [Rhodopirellula maiorica SM1]